MICTVGTPVRAARLSSFGAAPPRNGETCLRGILVRGYQAIVDRRANVWDHDHDNEAHHKRDLQDPLPGPGVKAVERKTPPDRKSHPAGRIAQRLGDELRTLTRAEINPAPISVFRAHFRGHLFSHSFYLSPIVLRFTDSCDCTFRWPRPPSRT